MEEVLIMITIDIKTPCGGFGFNPKEIVGVTTNWIKVLIPKNIPEIVCRVCNNLIKHEIPFKMMPHKADPDSWLLVISTKQATLINV